MKRTIDKIAVIGSGIMGGGIAALCAAAGYRTILLDIVPPGISEEKKDDPMERNRIVNTGLESLSKTRPPAFMDMEHDLSLIRTGNMEDNIGEISTCDLIFEVVVENIDIKRSVFEVIEKYRKEGSIVASNTSGLPIAEMARGRSDDFKKHFLIMHFFNPVRYMKLLELVAGEDTDPEICNFISSWAEKALGKGIVWGKDTPNFIGNRIGVELICEAFRLLGQGLSTITEADIIFSRPMGMPGTAIFGLADLVGNDTIGHLAHNSYNLLENDEYREIYRLPDFFLGMLKKGMLGKKTPKNGGFYVSTVDKNFKKTKRVLNIKTLEYEEYNRDFVPDILKEAVQQGSNSERLFHIFRNHEFSGKLLSSLFVYSANRIPEIADSIVDIDNAMKWGYAWEKGPFELWDELGVERSIDLVESYGFTIPDSVKRMISSGSGTFYRTNDGEKEFYNILKGRYEEIKKNGNMIFLSNIKTSPEKVVLSSKSASLIDLGDGVFDFEYHTKMNALNGEIVDMIPKAIEYVSKNGQALVIGNEAAGIPGAFSAGADLKFMLELAAAGKFDTIDSFVKNAQSGMKALKYSPFPVVVAPYGMTLGGGAESAMWADRIVAHSETYMGLVEIGAGLLPAGGGCTNLWRRHVESVVKEVKIDDLMPLFLSVFQQIAMAKVGASAMDSRNSGFLMPRDRIVFNRDYLIGEAKKEALRMIEDGYTPPPVTKIRIIGDTAMGGVYSRIHDLKKTGFLTPYMSDIAVRVALVLSGGDARPGSYVTEDYMLSLERKNFVELWKDERTFKMAEHIARTGRSLMI